MPARASSPTTRLVDIICQLTRPGGGVLHCGAGDGALITALLARGVNVRGVERHARVGHASAGRSSRAEPGALPFGASSFFTVVVSSRWLEGLGDTIRERALDEISRVVADTVILDGVPLAPDREAARSRAEWEQRFLERSGRRHTRVLGMADFESLEDEGPEAMLVLQKLPSRVAAAYPLGALAPERDLHMDMLRETGRRADAHIARYEWARGWVKPGDVVVDAACGLGYGAAILWDGSEASRVVGLDVSEGAVAYARESYSTGRPGVEFRACDVEPWEGWSDASVDCIVSFETLEHLVDPQRFLAGARRVLKPGGRFLCSVPHAWVDAAGRDPNPHHLHVFDLDGLVQVVEPFLLIDQIYAQSAGGHAERFAPRRLLRDVGWPEPDASHVDRAEWLLLSGVRDPLERCDVAYTETVFPAPAGRVPNATAFARDYENPWAVHAIVMGSFRVRSQHLLTELAERWLERSPPVSADAGAALCVLAYRALDSGGRSRSAPLPSVDSDALVARIGEYCAAPSARPGIRRWQVSLLFVLGQLHLCRGDLAAAEAAFRTCAAEDATAFSPHLETKTTEAGWLAGRLALERGDTAGAAADWAGVAASLERLKTASVAEWLVHPERPSAFETGDGLREIALAIDNATLCANGLRRLRDSAGAWRPGPEPVDRNLQRTASRLLETVHQRGGEIQSLRIELARARTELQQAVDEWNLARATLGRELSQCRAERAALLARLRGLPAGIASGSGLRVGIFGTGAAAMAVWEALSELDSVHVAWFADNDVAKHGQRFLWLDVLAPAALRSQHVDAIVIGSMHRDPIRRQLLDLGLEAHRILTPPLGATIEQLRRLLPREFERLRPLAQAR